MSKANNLVDRIQFLKTQEKKLDSLKINCLKKEKKEVLISVQKNWIFEIDLIPLVIWQPEDFIIFCLDLAGILLMEKKLFI
jgi:hypothetical protein